MSPHILGLVALISSHQTASAFTGQRVSFSSHVGNVKTGIDHYHRSSHSSYKITLSRSSPNDDDWGLEGAGRAGEDPRMEAMRSMLESSWDGELMGIVPSDPEKGAEAASESVDDAMRQSKNVLMVDLRLPSYDITEGPKMYDFMAAYNFCAFLSDKLRERKLIRKSLILVRNDKERVEIDRIKSERDAQSISNDKGVDLERNDEFKTPGESKEGTEVDDFRENLMASWDATNDYIITNEGVGTNSPLSEKKLFEDDNSPSHRLWSMLGDEEISSGPDMFDQVIAAVDENAILSSGEDALIILSPYATPDIIAIRRIMARYGQTRTVIIVNSRMETLPRELAPAVMVYGILPLIARPKGNDGGNEAGLKVVAMKRFPAEWSVYVDVYGDGFVEARGPPLAQDTSGLPSPEWISQRVQAHVEGLPKQQ
eukprot:CAMPEP_0172551992 /NCGR_PEP_ID=MMETSP1067-20121228/42971_1 /TAXON_ID=265564 ORGANISM="Thalassiosira punctigera, Strain Tpunct2005C2" /NCGR_SAMPLE_ID=MMETSP1067 /ASSEMBLY_ACC=CAM_ASM_000444 /LENGTH=426 /DNA_ID=CAMNT_0013339887 /DNA_START=32 /DNA_END=1312 /DNA_ORIENTATION=+